MTREEKIKFIIECIEDIEGVKVSPVYFEKHSDEKLDKLVEWYDYLYTK